MSNKPYLTREKIDTLLKQGIKKRDFEDQIGFFCTNQGYVYKSDKSFDELANDEICDLITLAEHICYDSDYTYFLKLLNISKR
jgi:hypothetical protein